MQKTATDLGAPADYRSHGGAAHACVVGVGWGDEGKGKVVDLLADAFDIVVRFNGGANAGHTVWVGEQRFALHLLPAGVLRDGRSSVIGPGVVIDPIALATEIDQLATAGIDARARLRVSDRAHLVLAYHRIEDQLSERHAGEAGKIGTTSRGIGPCYADKMKRKSAVRVVDLFDERGLEGRVRGVVAERVKVFQALYGEDGGLCPDAVLRDLDAARDLLRPCVCDTSAFLRERMDAGERILFEGANGMLLDIDHGTYPFVTSSSCGPHGVAAGAGVPAATVGRVVGVLKAYSTRVGSGPFVSELKDEVGDRIRKQGNEFGTTTGRPRRCGWFDAVACRRGVQLGGITDLALMHMDTLSGFDQVGVCVAYECDGKRLDAPPAHAETLARSTPVVEMMPGWREPLRQVQSFGDLPLTAREYLSRIESLAGAPISLVGVGPERSQTLVRERMKELLKPCVAGSGVAPSGVAPVCNQ